MYTAASPFLLGREQQEEIMKNTLLVTFMTFFLSVLTAGILVMSEQSNGIVSPVPSVSSILGQSASK